MTQCRHDILRDRGFELHIMQECDWYSDPRHEVVPQDYLNDPLVIHRKTPWLTSAIRIENQLECGKVHV